MATLAAIIVTIVTVFWAVIFVDFPRIIRLRRLAAKRDRANAKLRFQRAFPDLAPEFSEKAYRMVQSLVGGTDFPVDPDDELFGILDIDQGCIEHDLEEYCEQLGVGVPVDLPKMRTVRDYIRCLHDIESAAKNRAQ